jgi:PAS domain S-box-containing protein
VLGVPNATTGAIAWLLVQAHPELGPGELKPHRVFATLSDITRLKETEYRLAAIIESSPHGIVQADPQTGRPFWYNGAMQRLFGYAGLPMDDLTLADLHPPESLSLVEAELARIAAGDLAPSRDLPCRRRDGSLFYCTLSPGLTRLGQESRLTAFYTDTTERYLAEERVKESEARLSAVFDHAPIGMALVGPERRLALANRALGTFLGRLPESLVGLAFDALCHPGDLDRDLEQTAELLAGRIGSYRMTKRFLRPDGDLVWGDLRTVLLPTRPGEPPIPLKMVEDITELHAATERQQVLEEALTRYTSELEELVDIVNLSLPPVQQIAALLRLGAQALGLAAASLALVGERGEGLMPVAAHWEGIGFAEPEPPAPLLAEALANPGVPCVLGAEGMRESVLGLGLGSCVTLVFESPLPDGRASTLAMTLWGVERSFALGGAERQMLRLIAQRIGAVRFQERMQLDLVESRERETIGHLASGVAHDFNNLLGVIDANIYFLGSSLAELARSDPEIGQVMEETRSALGQAKVITSGMLSLSRAGGVPRGPVDLRALVGELEGILRHVLPPAVALFTAIPPGLKVLSNGAFLQSALLNLALNARDAMPEGGTIEIEAAPLRPDWTVPLAVGKLPEGHCVALSVTDTGTGIEPAILARIFDPLFSTKAKRRGHGLGLFMVQEFVARSGAGLAVESAPGAGTRFRLLLPLAERSASEGSGRGGPGAGDSPAPRTAAAPLAGLRILVVDDDPRVRDAVSRLLAIEGASLGSAEGGQAGLDLLGRDPGFDLVLSDIAMPGLDGFALLRRLADLRPELPVLLMTGQERSPGAAEGLPEGTPVLRKPIDPQALRESVLTAIAARQPGRAG